MPTQAAQGVFAAPDRRAKGLTPRCELSGMRTSWRDSRSCDTSTRPASTTFWKTPTRPVIVFSTLTRSKYFSINIRFFPRRDSSFKYTLIVVTRTSTQTSATSNSQKCGLAAAAMIGIKFCFLVSPKQKDHLDRYVEHVAYATDLKEASTALVRFRLLRIH